MSLRQNINKLHFDLTNKFEEVTITEKSDLKIGNYFEILVKESNKELKLIATKKDLEKNTFDWKYFSNPLNENSFLVERNSSVDKFVGDVRDIFEKNRFDSDYIKVLENNTTFSKEDFIGKKITDIVQNRYTTIQTGEISFSIGCSGGNTTFVEGDGIDETISDIIIDQYNVTILFESGERMNVEDDTGGEGIEIWKTKK